MGYTRQSAYSSDNDYTSLVCEDTSPNQSVEPLLYTPMALQGLPGAGNAFAAQLARSGSSSASSSAPTSGSMATASGYQLCVNSNVAGADGAGATDGHAWLTLQQGGNVISGNGLWPDDHPNIVASGLNNGDASDIRTGFGDDTTVGANQFCTDVTQEQFDNYNELLNDDEDWGYTNNCSSWASQAFEQVTGIDVDADDEGLLGVETPRELGDSIQELNQTQGSPTSSSSSSSSWGP